MIRACETRARKVIDWVIKLSFAINLLIYVFFIVGNAEFITTTTTTTTAAAAAMMMMITLPRVLFSVGTQH